MNNIIKHLPVQRVISVHELGRGWLIIAKLCHHPVWKMPLYSIVTDHRATVKPKSMFLKTSRVQTEA